MLRHCPLPSLKIKSMQKQYFLVWQVLFYHSNHRNSIFKLRKETGNASLSHIWISQSFLTSEFWSAVGIRPSLMNESEKVFPKSPCSGLFFEHSRTHQGCNETKNMLFTISSTLTLFLPGLLGANWNPYNPIPWSKSCDPAVTSRCQGMRLRKRASAKACVCVSVRLRKRAPPKAVVLS